ncbi:Rod shape-determining protein MreB [bacterium BMS3Abin07]|nr:Rod shape-determining protein MreB [bacterium BMS3Abin07]GBE31623.1 Rod shape-determining protein MreB [bacterium BMS3Bbin05]
MQQDESKTGEGVLFVGIDLGTSSSAISAGNGELKWVESYVGWPKDFIAAKVVGKPVLFGMDALKNRLSLDLYRPLEKGFLKEGTSKDEEAVRELIHHLVKLVKPLKGQKIHAVVGVPAESFKVNKLAIRKAVSGYAHSLMVVSEPFAVAYGLNLLNNAMVIDIGAGTVDFCIMHGTIPSEDDQSTILNAGDYIDQQLYNFLVEKHPDSTFNMNMVKMFKEHHGFVGDSGDAVKVEIPVKGKPVVHDITAEVKRACESILPAIMETITEMIAKFDPEYQAGIRDNIVLAGGGSLIKGIRDYIETTLRNEYGSCSVRAVDDPLFAGAKGALALAEDMPIGYWDQM